MKNRRHDLIESKELVRLDQLLESLKKVPLEEPPSAIKKRLNELYIQCLWKEARSGVHRGNLSRKLPFWFKPAAAFVLLIAASVGAMLLVHFHQRDHLRAGNNPGTRRSEKPPVFGNRTQSDIAASTANVTPAPLPHRHRSWFPSKVRQSLAEMTVHLPYSDNSIAEGTSTTIQVAMSQSELVSLGFPLAEPLENQRVIAELTLGDDGLPRAITLPLPLEVVQEKK